MIHTKCNIRKTVQIQIRILKTKPLWFRSAPLSIQFSHHTLMYTNMHCIQNHNINLRCYFNDNPQWKHLIKLTNSYEYENARFKWFTLQILWKTKHSLSTSKHTVFKNIFKENMFKRRERVLLWGKGLNCCKSVTMQMYTVRLTFKLEIFNKRTITLFT